jgi:hypothetical protein
VESVLRPLFFASIGFAIPITKMFTGRIIWRGLVYTILMVFAKVICGLWLVRFASMPRAKSISKSLSSLGLSALGSMKTWLKASGAASEKSPQAETTTAQRPQDTMARQSSNPLQQFPAAGSSQDATGVDASTRDSRPVANTTRKRTALPRPKSLYPAAILGSAMVSRGEIGFLISSVAEANGVFGEGGNTEEFLVVTWAILLCTLIGPITVGLLVKRVRRLQQAERQKLNGQEDPLGVWGVLPSNTTA